VPQPKAAVEFDQAINYVNKIKVRAEPQTLVVPSYETLPVRFSELQSSQQPPAGQSVCIPLGMFLMRKRNNLLMSMP
jgi:hypothetical protein